jgi:multidrug efflux pump subunit AcrB
LGFESQSENSIVRTRHRLPTLTVKCDPIFGYQATDVFDELRPKVETMFDKMKQKHDLEGYTLEWGGEYEDSHDAQVGLKSRLGPIALLMVLVVIILYNSIRKPLVIFLTVPLGIVGVTIGLLTFSQPFGFMALLGLMSLSGIIILNALVLISEIDTQLAAGKEPLEAVVDAGVSRLRPVSMTAITTVLGMIPLLTDAFFVAMAVTIMFGLTFATVLTLLVVPVLYVSFFKIPYREIT